MRKNTERLRDVVMSADAKGLVGHAGGVHLQLMAERAGLADALTFAMRRPGFTPLHPRGKVLTDLACAIVLGGESIRDMRLLEHQRPVLGSAASFPTAWRTLDEVGDLQLRRIARARAEVRRRVWGLLAARPDGFPWITVDGQELTGWTVIDSDATVIPCGSEKEGASGTYKKGVFGLCPMIAYCDNTGEMLAQELRPGNAGCNDAEDNIAILEHAVAQLPWQYRKKVLFRVDGAGFSHEVVAWIAGAGGRRSPSFTWEYSVGWAFTEREMAAVRVIDRKNMWEAAVDADGSPRQDAFVADITGLLGNLTGWPPHHTVIVRKEPLHPRYTKDASAYEQAAGVRLQTFATNTRGRQPAWLDSRHRSHARVEPNIRDSKAAGLGRVPSRHMQVNKAWLVTVAIACDLRAWLQLLACQGEMTKATPKTLRYRLLHVPAVIVRGQRRRRLKIPADWPWAAEVLAAFKLLRALPRPT